MDTLSTVAPEIEADKDEIPITELDELVPVDDTPGKGQPTVIIEPIQPGARFRFREVWRYRKLLRFFARKYYQRLYQKTVLGKGWVYLRPLGGTIMGALVFGGLLGAPSEGVPYFIFILVGQSSWELFDRSLLWVTRSLYMNRKILKKMYFPRLILLIASVTPGLAWYRAYVILVFVAIFAYVPIDHHLYLNVGPELLVAVAGLLLAVVLAIGIGMFTSILGATTRDMRFILRYILQLWMFITPVIYPLSALPHSIQGIAMLNPLTPIVEMIKWGMIGAGSIHMRALAFAGVEIVVLYAVGLWFFNRAGATSVDNL